MIAPSPRSGASNGSGSQPTAKPTAKRSAKPVSKNQGQARGSRWLLLLIVTLGSLHVAFMIGVEGLRLARAEIAIAKLEREVAALEREAEGLRAVIEHADDARYREQLARRQGYMYPEETRIVTSEPR